jgi:hypothetical protein
LKIFAAVFFFLTCSAFSYSDGGAGVFFPGEKLVYRITALRFLSAGSAEFTVKEPARGDERGYILKASADSSRLFSLFFRVKNTMESVVDADTLLPESFEKNRREAAFRRNVLIDFDRENNIAVPRDNSAEPFSVPPGVHDYLSMFYSMRGMDLTPGNTAVFTATGGRKTYDVRIEALRRETALMLGREIEAVVVSPSVSDFEAGGVVEEDSPEILIWITDDERRLPLRMEMDVSFGRVVMVLVDYSEGVSANAKGKSAE